jgi:hypothetical protein
MLVIASFARRRRACATFYWLLSPWFVGLTAQETKPSCNRCSATHIPESEIQAHLNRATGEAVSDQQDIGVVYRGKTNGDPVAEHDMVSEVYRLDPHWCDVSVEAGDVVIIPAGVGLCFTKTDDHICT